MTQDLRKELELVGIRLGETWQALTASKRINEIGSSNPDVQEAISKHSGFWETALLALQTTWIMGIFALLDKDTRSASLYSLLTAIKSIKDDPKLNEMPEKLDLTRERYIKYRNKLFAHTDKQRIEFINKFDQEEFTWQQTEDDMLFLDYVWKALWFTNDGKEIPTEDKARCPRFPHNNRVKAVEKHTEALLNELAARESPPNNSPGVKIGCIGDI